MSAGSIRIGVVAVVMLAVIGCKKEDRAAPTTTSSPSPTSVPSTTTAEVALPTTVPSAEGNYKPAIPPATNPSAKFKLTAQQMEAEARQDPMGAKAKYDGQRVEVSGIVRRINITFNGTATISLVGPQSAELPSVPAGRPTTGPSRGEGVNVGTIYAEPWALFAPDQTVTFVGTGRIQGSSAFLTNAEATQAGPSPAVAIAATDLAAEFAKDPDATENHYKRTALNGKTIVLSGAVIRVANEKLSGKPSGVYVGSGNAKILCHFEYTEPNQTRLTALRPGEQLKIVGEFSGPAPDEKATAYLTNCCIITK
jgi:hypothetical protein